jgi:hypothetical protein
VLPVLGAGIGLTSLAAVLVGTALLVPVPSVLTRPSARIFLQRAGPSVVGWSGPDHAANHGPLRAFRGRASQERRRLAYGSPHPAGRSRSSIGGRSLPLRCAATNPGSPRLFQVRSVGFAWSSADRIPVSWHDPGPNLSPRDSRTSRRPASPAGIPCCRPAGPTSSHRDQVYIYQRKAPSQTGSEAPKGGSCSQAQSPRPAHRRQELRSKQSARRGCPSAEGLSCRSRAATQPPEAPPDSMPSLCGWVKADPDLHPLA